MSSAELLQPPISNAGMNRIVHARRAGTAFWGIKMSQPNKGMKLSLGIAVAAALLTCAIGIGTPSVAADNGAAKWKVWTYNASNRALRGSVPANTNAGIATFAFPLTPDVALLVTDHGSYKGSLLGDMSGKTISATVSDSGGPFTYFGEGPGGTGTPDNPCPGTPTVRLFFQTSNAGGFSGVHYWWSNPVSRPLNGLTAQTTMSESFANPAGWSDYFGKFGSDPAYSAGYQDAVKNVTSIGLSFGGGCFFENGVGAPSKRLVHALGLYGKLIKLRRQSAAQRLRIGNSVIAPHLRGDKVAVKRESRPIAGDHRLDRRLGIFLNKFSCPA
jgi:hypothetical protein